MKFLECSLKGAFLIEIEKHEDERGFFARSWDGKIFRDNGMNTKIAQCSISFNKKKGSVRGIHYQKSPFEEDKIVRCTRGKIFDVIVDLRKDSPTYSRWEGFEISENNYKMLYIPKGFAHGFQTLEDDTEVFYQISEFFMPDYSSGVRWDDPKIMIKWPLTISAISKKDLSYQLI
jgi:dTDP-4-dehydrorhamnose 3,5-epimerase